MTPGVLFLCIALYCDFRIASENAKFGYYYVKRGIAGEAMGINMLAHLVGVSKALELLLTGELIDAAEAERIGLVGRIVSQDELMDEARNLARRLMKAAPLAQRVVKQAVHKALFDPSNLDAFIRPKQQALFDTEDHLEGAGSWAERREPVYKGR